MRAAAARVVHAVRVDGRSLTTALAAAAGDVGVRDQPLLTELCYGTLRLLPRLDALVAILLTRPLRRADRVLNALMAVGLYQLIYTRIPAHAAVAATVDATRALGRARAAGLVNAALRRFQREHERLLAEVGSAADDPALFPDWLLRRLQAAWPEHWRRIVAASNQHPPMTLRVNRRRQSLRDYADALAAAGIAARLLAGLDSALILDQPVPTQRLPGFAEGRVSVQDAAAQCAALFLDPQPGERVLDACAAPGNKTAHLLEHADGELALTAVDADAERLLALRENLARLGLRAQVLVADAGDAAPDWPGAPYDAILLDAPCSATGVIRRHPDIKYLRRAADIPALAATQDRLLAALWPLLRPGGRLLYATCSVLPEENQQRVAAFLASHRDALERPLAPPAGVGEALPGAPGVQLLPAIDGGDGFYFALLERTP
ncbi:16S rRNA (cytosine(967)-C(5))-methyltransferase RsmB [uncultured Thiohalocapsa sp.]|uniref:16S rRNA (cytosine(967)-C(5))-methyltransferase RsmB n=1 Tax=uncultured Thiohalocapsa sp. TaxID=768990 RepID=UPI0025D303F6|nr:16S rRNA (cytosine(967)-C(5))-methyltransferase RsmB [uncultured Thiohalocapsa sp.]